MKKPASIALLALSAALFAGGVFYLFNRQFAGGDAYPPYSSLRSDPAGAKVIFESLRRLPGVTVTRSFQPLDRVPDRDSTVLLLGIEPRGFALQQDAEVRAFEEFAQRGNRLVFAMAEASGQEPPPVGALEKRWGVRFGPGSPAIVERAFGKGSIVLVADSRLFGNRSVADAKQTELLTRIIGPHTRIVFDEAHFGIVESGSVVALARRFRLHGLALGLALVALLFIWKNASSFPPISSAPPAEKVLGRTSVAGLVTLLHRHIAPDRLAAACCQEWLKSHAREIAPARRAQAEAAIRNQPDRPTEALREIQTILRAKGAI